MLPIFPCLCVAVAIWIFVATLGLGEPPRV
jgi:hypothetical protein